MTFWKRRNNDGSKRSGLPGLGVGGEVGEQGQHGGCQGSEDTLYDATVDACHSAFAQALACATPRVNPGVKCGRG